MSQKEQSPQQRKDVYFGNKTEDQAIIEKGWIIRLSTTENLIVPSGLNVAGIDTFSPREGTPKSWIFYDPTQVTVTKVSRENPEFEKITQEFADKGGDCIAHNQHLDIWVLSANPQSQ